VNSLVQGTHGVEEKRSLRSGEEGYSPASVTRASPRRDWCAFEDSLPASPVPAASRPQHGAMSQSVQLLVGREEHAVAIFATRSPRYQSSVRILPPARRARLCWAGRFTPSDGCTFMIRSTWQHPRLGEGIQVSRSRRGVPMGKPLLRTRVMMRHRYLLLCLDFVCCVYFSVTSDRQNCQGAFSLIRNLPCRFLMTQMACTSVITQRRRHETIRRWYRPYLRINRRG